MTKIKYLINNSPVKNLNQWCIDRKLSINTFKQAIKRAKLKGSNESHPLGFHVIRL